MKRTGGVEVLCRKGALMRVWDSQMKRELIGGDRFWRMDVSVMLGIR
jgi:hypothetical protein